MDTKILKRNRRHSRIRSRIMGTESKPRLCVFKSNKAIYAQAINDEKGETIASADSKNLKDKGLVLKASNVGKEIAKALMDKKIDSVVFDRGGFIYSGAVKSLADGAREAGLKF